MLEHYIQKNIVMTLARVESLRFSELKPDDLENKLFDYHLKKVVLTGLVEKLMSGEYALTPLGRRVGKYVVLKSDEFIDRVLSVLFLAVRRESDGAWLLSRRKVHPLFDKVGFMDAKPHAEESIAMTAHDTALTKTGLDCDFTVRGSGYLRMYDTDALESFTHFTVLESMIKAGDLQQNDEQADYFWQEDPDFSSPDMLPTPGIIADKLAQPGLFFIETSMPF